MKAPDILRKAISHMEDRAAARDQGEGERSMARTVAAFNAITGHALTERDGWMFMVQLKAARACTTPTGIADDYEDLAAYAGLAGESVAVHANDNNVVPGFVYADNTKEILIESVGRVRLAPEYKWIAQDHDGAWFAYPHRPIARDGYYGLGGNSHIIGRSRNRNELWRSTLRQVRE